MAEKRYAIVRVEHYCPIIEDNNGDLKQTPYCPQDKDKNFLCSDCKMLKNYGDTKEQLIRKVATVLRRILKVDVCSYKYKGKMRKLETIRFKGKGRFDEIVIELEEAATKIVEFLGVE